MIAKVVVVIVATSLVTVLGCAVEDASATAGASTSSSSSSGDPGGSSSGDTLDPGDSAEKPKLTPMEACVSDCKKTRTSNGWCRAYCECRTGWLNGNHRECSEHASESYIDI